jgi:hypothetical protein
MKKNALKENQRILARLKKELEPLKKEEAEAKRLWVLGHKKFLRATKELNSRIDKGLTVNPVDKDGKINKHVSELWDVTEAWESKSQELEDRRARALKAIEDKQIEIVTQEQELQRIIQEEQAIQDKKNELLDTTFVFHSQVAEAEARLNDYLSREVYPLLDEKSSQLSIESSDGMRKLVISVNTINVMDVSKVAKAQERINAFFDRINPRQKEIETEDETILLIKELVQELLVVKVNVKAGPNLSRFLSLKLDKEKFQELVEAQEFLVSATNFQRSSKYIRLYRRNSRNEGWEAVRK